MLLTKSSIKEQKAYIFESLILDLQHKCSQSVSKGQIDNLQRYHYIPTSPSLLATCLIKIKRKNPLKNIKFIDFGCGFPFTLEIACKIGYETKGFEIDKHVFNSRYLDLFHLKKNIIKKDITKITTKDLETREGQILVCYFYVPICGPLQIKFEENLLKIIPKGTYIIGLGHRTLHSSDKLKRIPNIQYTFIKK